MNTDKFQVRVQGPAGHVEDQENVTKHLETLQSQIIDHMLHSPDYFYAADLEVQLVHFSARKYGKSMDRFSVRWEIELNVSGTVNGLAVNYATVVENEVHRRKASWMTAFMTLVEGDDLITVYANDYSLVGDHHQVMISMADITYEILNDLNQRVGLPIGNIKNQIYLICGILASIVLLFTAVYAYIHPPPHFKPEPGPLGKAIISSLLGLFLGGMTFAGVFCLSYLFMPTRFFHEDTFGRNLMYRSQVKSVWGLKSLLVLGISLFCCAVYFLLTNVPP